MTEMHVSNLRQALFHKVEEKKKKRFRSMISVKLQV